MAHDALLITSEVAGEVFIRPKNCGGAAPLTEQQQIPTFQFSPVISDTSEPVICSFIFKSEQDVNDVPLNWKLGIDSTIEVKDAEQMEKVETGRPNQVSDARSLNAERIIGNRPGKSKEKLCRAQGKPKFEPADIVPLVKKSFPKSYGKYKKESKPLQKKDDIL
jgi:hypothetical protein